MKSLRISIIAMAALFMHSQSSNCGFATQLLGLESKDAEVRAYLQKANDEIDGLRLNIVDQSRGRNSTEKSWDRIQKRNLERFQKMCQSFVLVIKHYSDDPKFDRHYFDEEVVIMYNLIRGSHRPHPGLNENRGQNTEHEYLNRMYALMNADIKPTRYEIRQLFYKISTIYAVGYDRYFIPRSTSRTYYTE